MLDPLWTAIPIFAVVVVLAGICFAVWRLEKGIEAREILLRKAPRIRIAFKKQLRM